MMEIKPIMPALQADIDDLDRMVDTGAQKDAIRSQIRLIAREIAALEADYAGLAQAHTKLQKEHSELEAELARKIAGDKKELSDWLTQKAEQHRKLLRSKQLNYNV